MWDRNKNRENKCLNKKFLKEIGEIKEFYFSFLDFVFKAKESNLKNKTFLIKKVKDANSITKKTYEQLLITSKITNSFPLIIAEQYNQKNNLEEGVLYKFKDIYVMNEKTFQDFLEEGKVYLVKKKSSVKLIKEKEEKDLFKLNDKELFEIIDKVGFNPFNEDFFKKLDLIFQEMMRKKLKSNLFFNHLIEIGKPFNSYELKKEVFIKEVTKFDKQKEEKIIEFFNFFEEKAIYFVEKFKKPIEKENLIIVPKNLPKHEFKRIFEEFLFD